MTPIPISELEKLRATLRKVEEVLERAYCGDCGVNHRMQAMEALQELRAYDLLALMRGGGE